jgi:hypothetical protein
MRSATPPNRAPRRRGTPAAALGLLAALAAPAAAEVAAARGEATPLSAEDFRAFAEGWTLHFESRGAPFGVETFGAGGRTLWRPEGGDCRPGRWSADGGAVCFDYGGERACWRLWRDGAGVVARSEPAGATEVRVARRDRAPLSCDGDLLSRRDAPPAPRAPA